MSLLNPAKLDESNLIARFDLGDEEETLKLGRVFSSVLNPENMDCVGFIAPVGTGKSTLVKGIHEGLGASYGSFEKMMIMMNGMNTNLSSKGCLIRHFDLKTQPEGEEDNIPSHWRALESGLDRDGVDLVEHALKCREERFSYIFKLSSDPESGIRTAEIYCADELNDSQEVADFITSLEADI